MVALFSSCGGSKNAYLKNPIMLDTLEIATLTYKPSYHPSEKRSHDLIHTTLYVSFDWDKREVIGEAELILEPFFYPTQTLELDAKGFDIQRIAMKKGASKRALNYFYDDKIITIDLGREYLRKERYEIYIEYIAKPTTLLDREIIQDSANQGLFFRNPDKSDTTKMRQIFTQGETEQSSCWFPTIDAPNERTSQELFITIDDDLVSLSNGKLVKSTSNGNGTHTDHWAQAQHHAPYLFAMAIGEFSVVRDESWNGKIIDYYVAKEYESHAKTIFKNTREILSFYSELFGVDYPWDKYSQVIADDFVTGAMENTGAVIFFEGLHMTDRELLDDSYEPIIAHEAAHHWFGNLVTCESWANIALNEAFATYSEVLWEKHKYGNDAAHYMVMDYLDSYMEDSETNQKKIIRYIYEHPDDLFDSHSYEKGGHVLYMLHNYIGDEAFFEGIKLYLTEHAYQSVEIHDLRMAFEDVCGEDLNWFFDQWFFKAGYPELEVSYEINEVQTTINVKQSQKNGVRYNLPLAVDIYTDSKIERKSILLDKSSDSFTFPTEGIARFVNLDAENILLGTITEKREMDSYLYEFYNAPHFQDRYSALKTLTEKQGGIEDVEKREGLIKDALQDKFWVIREEAINAIVTDNLEAEDLADLKENFALLLKNIALSDKKTIVSAAAIDKLAELEISDFKDELIDLTSSRSYAVAASALKTLSKVDKEAALQISETFETEKNNSIKLSVLDVYAYNASDNKNDFMVSKMKNATSYMKYPSIYYYSYFLVRQSDEEMIMGGIEEISDEVKNDENPLWLRRSTIAVLSDMLPIFQKRIDRKVDEMKPEQLSALTTNIKESIYHLLEEFPELKLIQQPSQ